ncbi:autotransporter outer membrane beta-barrel domain-containing protein [uncultured Albimonas sp.]|uniref:autotransporter outer membrane beta-barrel domain-containing protein n=1 Tax=uncultured Albimonas sp. TaxID=1331701 RepID=UPI0030ED12CC
MSFIVIETRAVGVRSRLRAGLLGTCCVAALGLSAGGASAQSLANCETGSTTDGSGRSCDIPEGAAVSGAQVFYTGPQAPSSDDRDAIQAGAYALSNRAILSGPAAPGQFAVLGVQARGGQGSNEGSDAGVSGAGGVVTVENFAALTLTDLLFSANSGAGAVPGMWSRDRVIYGIHAAGIGGQGINAKSQTIGGGDGGHGGAGGNASVANRGAILLGAGAADDGGPRVGAIGILSSSTGGDGGQRDTTAGEDPRGGNGGDAKVVQVTNVASIQVCGATVEGCETGDRALRDVAAGIFAQSMGGRGANPTSSGGNGGLVDVRNEGDITVNALVERDGGAWGIYAASQAGYASIDSVSNGVPGGAGGDSKKVTVGHDGAIVLRAGDFDAPQAQTIDRACVDGANCAADAHPAFVSQSAGILAATYGAAAGASKDGISGQNGGKGGDASVSESGEAFEVSGVALADNASVDVAGDNVIGVGVFAQGGLGGLGNSTNSFGGDGGDAGDLEVSLGAGSSIATDGENAVGLILYAKGGAGGGVRAPGGLVDFNDDSAGQGGDSGLLTLKGPGAGAEAARISTRGDRALGVALQSLAGGGGSADADYSIIDTGSTNGGAAGVSGGVDVSGRFDIFTSGQGAHGMLLQSISGGGGSLTSDNGFVAVSGGGGSEGAEGGTVRFVSEGGRIDTAQTASMGLVAQSIGGGGGDVIGEPSLSIVTVGGQGGPGGAGGLVDLTFNDGTVTTTAGDYSFGLVAQSIGGGGGNGGNVFSIDVVLPATAVGGDGGVGGGAGRVNFFTGANAAGDRHLVSTLGGNAHGVLLQAIGGGGGTGGDARSTSLGLIALTSVAMAGGGDSGGAGGLIEGTLRATDIVTSGSHARGLIAHSVGGGGGAGGAANSLDVNFGLATAVGVGGKGGDGGAGGAISIDLTDVSIATGVERPDSDSDSDPESDPESDYVANNHGIVVQSIGGGGGTGGSADALAYALDLPIPEADVQIAMAGAASVGGTGGTGGDGGAVGLSLTDTSVSTRGDGAHGILAHSVGGGGGDGGDSSSLAVGSLLLNKLLELVPGEGEGGEEEAGGIKINVSVAVSVGGQGASSGAGGDVDLTLDGTTLVETFGLNSNAAMAQSVSNGGGNGGVAGASTNKFGEGSGVKTAISVGGMGGNAAETAGDLHVRLGEDTVLRTHAEGSRGLMMQTVGGGGGASQSASVSFSSKLTDAIAQKLGGVKAPRLSVGVGMTGGAGGAGGDIGALELDGGIETFGADADGVLVQTIGGGGGMGGGFGGGGTDEDGDRSLLDFGLELKEIKEQIERPWALNVNVGGRGGLGGNGGEFAVVGTETDAWRMPTLDGAVITHGDYSDGVVLQSIGGGGGVGGGAVPHDSIGVLDLSLRLGGTGGDGGAGGNVGFRLGEDAAVSTAGFGAHGVVLQSIGGGGGMGGSASRLVANLGIEAETTAPSNGDGETFTNDDPAFDELNLDEILGDGEEPLAAAVVRLGVGASGPGGGGASAARAEANGEGGLIQTTGGSAFGLTVQSVGGGGGMGGVGTAPLTAAELAIDTLDPDDRQPFADAFNALFRGAHLDFIAGGDGGRGGNGGAAVAQGAFTILTAGPRSPALLVQSVGGGGGAAGVEGARLLRNGAQGAVGNAGAVRTQLEAGTKINTDGLASHGSILQSVAGGGGTTLATLAYGSALRRYDPDAPPATKLDLLFELALGAGDQSLAQGRAGSAVFILRDDITTRGDGAYGAIVQSIGGGGGVVSLTPAEIDRATTTSLSSGEVVMGSAAQCQVGTACGGADRFDVTLGEDSFITTLGAGSRGVVAQSVQSGGGVATGFELLERATAGESANLIREISILGANAFPDALPVDASFVADGDIQTLGADADGVVMQAIAGGGGVIGGAGGASWTYDEDKDKRQPPAPVSHVTDPNSYIMSIDLGQSTAQAGIQNLGVTAELGGAIRTWGDYAEAAIVQSISGGGGVAGLSHDQTSDSTASVSVRVGGSGTSSAGAADRQRAQGLDANAAAGGIAATLTGDFVTSGWGANGVVLQEIMGGGGIAAVGSTTVRAVANNGQHGLLVGGDYGGTFGSAALAATMNEGARIRTAGAGATGLLAQNIVGGGGVGALGNAIPIKFGQAQGVVEARLGGSNSTGQANGNGETIAAPGVVTLEIGDAILVTRGIGASALLAQSIGGGGGLALLPAPWMSRATLGASGGGTSYGGAIGLEMGVDAAGPSLVQTAGNLSRGVTAQSISGGGGQLSAPSFDADWADSSLPVQLGATGAATGWSDTVDVLFGGAIATAGDHADGLAAQSIAGGGGIADLGKTYRGGEPDVYMTLGQTQGGGKAGAVRLRHTGRGEDGGAIFTLGEGAYGMLAQSIGGGGGLATFSDLAGGARLSLGSTSTSGDDRASGTVRIVPETISQSTSGTVTSSLGQVLTQGDDAHAIVAQSISGGGGVARLGEASGSLALQLGGHGGDGANESGETTVEMNGRVVTTGDRAIGVVAQSISGGGGLATTGGANVSDLRLGGLQGYVGVAEAGDVSVTLGAPESCSLKALDTCAMTFGEGAHGIVAQSIAGGGGIGGDISLAKGLRLVNNHVGGLPDTSIERMYGAGDAGRVGVFVDAPLITHGDGAYGVIAQSLGGGGGLGGGGAAGGFAGLNTTGSVGKGNSITFIMDSTTMVAANGVSSTAVFLQSLGGGNGRGLENVFIDAYVGGLVQGGSGDSAYGILMHGGGERNTIRVYSRGTVTALSGEAIRYVSRDDLYDSHVSIENYGVIDGTISFVRGAFVTEEDGSEFGPDGQEQSGASARGAISAAARRPVALAVRPTPLQGIDLINHRGGVLMGAERYDADVLNRGLLVAGDSNDHSELAISGDFEMGPRAVLAVDANPMRAKGDLISVGGDARLDGEMAFAARSLIGGAEHRVMEVEGDISGAFDRVAGALFRFEQTIENGGLTLRASGIEIERQPGVEGQEAAAARYLERLFLSGERDFARFFGRLEAAAAGGALLPALSGMTMGASLAGEAATFELARDRFDALLDCGTGGRSVSWGGEGAGCLTMLGAGRDLSQDGNGAAAGYDGQAWTAGFAGSMQVAPGWRVSGALGWETLNLSEQGGGSSVDGTSGFLGAGVTRQMGALALSAAATAGWSEFDTSRGAGILAPGGAEAEHGALSLGARLRADWTQELDGGWLRPSLDLDLIHVAAEGYTETGAGRRSLRVEDSDATAFVLTPAIEAGLRRDLGDNLGLRAWARVGVSLSSLDSYEATARFANDATGVPGFVNGAAQSQAVGRIGLGASLQAGERVDVGLGYEGAFADGYTGHTGRASVTVRF